MTNIEIPERIRDWKNMPRFQERRTSLGYLIFPVFDFMIPERDPERDGSEWYAREMSGSTEKNWRSEHELDFSASSGGLIYPDFDIRRDVLIYPVTLQKHWHYGVFIDPGVTATAALFSCLTDKGNLIHIAEYYEGSEVGQKEALSATEHALNLIRRAQMITNEIHGIDRDSGRPVVDWDRVFRTQILDPSSWRREGSSEDLGSTAQRYIDAGFEELEKGTRDLNGGIQRVREWELRSVENQNLNIGVTDWENPPIGWPRKFANPGLVNYISEKQHYHYDHNGDEPAKGQMDHLCDCDRMASVYFRESPNVPKESDPPPTVYDIKLEMAMRYPKQRGKLWLPRRKVWG